MLQNSRIDQVEFAKSLDVNKSEMDALGIVF